MISVILPLYNVETFIDDAVESVWMQTYADWELLLIDDGSTDASPQKCDAWAQKDSRIHVIHKENGGVSSARNAGLDAAQGDYIFFLDSDDYIHPMALEILYSILRDNNADIAVSFSRGTDQRDYSEPDREDYIVRTASGKQTVEFIYLDAQASMRFFGYTPMVIWARLYKRAIFQSIRFDPDARMAEDLTIVPYLLDSAQKVVSTDRRLYYVYHRPGSLTRSELLPDRAAELCRTVCRMYKDRLDYFRAKRQDGYEDLLRVTYRVALNDLIEKRYKFKAFNSCHKILRTGLREILRMMRKDKVHSWTYLLRNYLFAAFPFLYSVIYKLTAEK